MAQSIDITLPKSHKARFPDRCVVCGTRSPGSHVRVITGSIGWWTWLLWWFVKPFVVDVPSCKSCAWKLRVSRLLPVVAFFSLLVVAYFLAPYVAQLLPVGPKGALLLSIMVGFLPFGFVCNFFSRYFYFDVTAQGNTAEYTFSSEGYAAQFALLNGGSASSDLANPEEGLSEHRWRKQPR